MILSTSSYSTTEPFHWNYSTEMKSTAREVSTHISFLGSISEIRESDLLNYVVFNTGTVGRTDKPDKLQGINPCVNPTSYRV
jgi:hypothetical protein